MLIRRMSLLLALFAPRRGLCAIDPSAVSRDPEVVADYARDPAAAQAVRG